MIQFYAPDIASSPVLGPEEAIHCVRVLRKKPGDEITVTDGRGKRYDCRILKADTRSVPVEILGEREVEKSWSYRITLAVAPTKNADRMSWLVEKATEIGVDEIIFLQCTRSERKNVNLERLRRNAVSAMNQSLKTRLPELRETKGVESLSGLGGEKYFGYCDVSVERLEFVKELKPGADVVIVIGPEGDFSEDEVKKLAKSGYRPVTFGNERLRTETAALYGITAVHVINDYIKHLKI